VGERVKVPSRADLEALRDAQGGAALLGELSHLPSDPAAAFAFQKLVFDLVRDFGDPGAAEALVAYLGQRHHPYFETRAAQALAALGDLRAAPYLAQRLRWDPLELYSEERDYELPLRRDDQERVISARLIADLAELHPAAHAELAGQTADALWAWLEQRPAPHANGLRALATMQATQRLEVLRAWANPQQALPLQGQQPPLPDEWVIAQVALRYVGKLRDAPSLPVLLAALQRRPADVDGTMAGILANGNAVLGMSLRALGVGAADGLAEWGDRAGFQPLLRYVEDRASNEQSRMAAGAALGFVGSASDLSALARRIAKSSKTKAERFEHQCFLAGLRVRPVPGVVPSLLPALERLNDPELRIAVAEVLGHHGLDAASEATLTRWLARPELQVPAALALLLGGSATAASSALRSFASPPAASLSALQAAYHSALNAPLYVEDVTNGTLFRYVRNADAVASVLARGSTQGWVRQTLSERLQNVVFDDGPHSVTRVVLDHRLRAVARGDDAQLARLALRTFLFLDEAGQLFDLSRGQGPLADVARGNLGELRAKNAAHPKLPLYD
jgi:hypothetical protein